MKTNLVLAILLLWPTLLLAKEKAPITYTVPIPPPADFSPLDWLLGDWSGKILTPGPQGDVRLNFSYALEKRFVIVREEIILAETNALPGSKEYWMGILSLDSSSAGFVMRVYSSTGFMTRYRVTVEGPAINFNPEGGDQPPQGWLFRRIIQRVSPEELSETVQAAPPNKAFFDYFTVKLSRVKFQERIPAPISP